MAPHITPRWWPRLRLEGSLVIADVSPPYLLELHLVDNKVHVVVVVMQSEDGGCSDEGIGETRWICAVGSSDELLGPL